MLLKQSPVFRLLLPFLAGVIAVIFYSFPVFTALFLFVIACAIYIIFLNIKIVSTSYVMRWMTGIVINLLFYSLGCMITWMNTDLNSTIHFSNVKSRFYYAEITEPPVVKEKTIRIIAAVKYAMEDNTTVATTGKLMIYLENTGRSALKYGDAFIFYGKPVKVSEPMNPFEFNYAQYLRFHNIYHQAYLEEKDLKYAGIGNKNLLFESSYLLRDKLIETLKMTISDKEIYSVGSALLVGFDDDIDRSVLNAYSSSGTLHVLSVSGMHVAIIYKVLEWLLKWLLKIKNGRHFYFLSILLFIWFYSFLTGMSPSVMRSAMMLSFVLLGKWSARNTGVLNTLAVSCFLLLIYNPYLLTEAGFQLSFLAVLGIVYLHPMLFQHYLPPNKLMFAIWSIVSVSLCAQLLTFPLGLFYFHQFPNYFVIANLVIIPATTAAIYCCIALVILFKVPVLGFLLGKCCYACIWFSNEAAMLIDKLPLSVSTGIVLDVCETLFIYVIIAAGIAYLVEKRWIQLTTFLVATLLFQLNIVAKYISMSQQQVLSFYAIKNHTAIGFTEGRDCYLYADRGLLIDSNKIKFHLQQHWFSLGTVEPVIINDSVLPEYLFFEKNILQFNNKRIFIVDSLSAMQLKPRAAGKLLVDYILIRGNAPIKIKEILNHFQNQKIIIDLSNNFRSIKKWKSEAKRLNTYVYSMDEKGALIIKFAPSMLMK